MPTAAQEVMVERLEVLTLAGRAGDAYENGIAALADPARQDSRAMIMATARAAVGRAWVAEAAHLLARLESGAESTDLDVAVLRAHCALADRRPEALELGKYAARLACEQNRFDVACEAWVIVGRTARRWGTGSAAGAFGEALSLSRAHQLPVWQVSALAELGMLDLASDSDPTRFHQARDLAVSTGMVGVVAYADLWIGAILAMRRGYVAAYPTFAQADTLARQLRLVSLHARARAQIAQCLVNADGQPLPGRTTPTWTTEADEVVAEALELGLASDPVDWAPCALGITGLVPGRRRHRNPRLGEGASGPRRGAEVCPVVGDVGPPSRRHQHRTRGSPGGHRRERRGRPPRQPWRIGLWTCDPGSPTRSLSRRAVRGG